MSEDVVKKLVEEIREAIRNGKKVIINGTVVQKIDVMPSKRSYVIIINDVVTMYPSQFIRAKKVIL